MTWFTRLKTATKLIVAFCVVAVVTAVLGFASVRNMATLAGLTSTMYETDALGLAHLKEANEQLLRISRAVGDAIIADSSTTVDARIADIKEFDAAFRKEFGLYQQTVLVEEMKVKAAEASARFGEIRVKQDVVLALARAGKDDEAIAGRRGALELVRQNEALMDILLATKFKRLETAAEEANKVYLTSRTFVITLVVVTVALALVIGFFVARLISRPLIQAVNVLQTVAQGDFTQRLHVESGDEVGQMAVALNHAVGAMQNALTEVRGAADEVSSASQQLSAGSEEISSGAQEQASSLEETASSLEQIASTIKQNADNAQQANQLASGARDIAEKGGRVVGQAVQAMSEINESSKQIADIITTIDEIAFQTNLLALNAAVEAARAGEQGRGFAVVAAEVRTLAKRSATAAKEIKGLIQDSVRKVENGSALVNQSGQTLEEIVTAVKRVTDIVGEIAAASREQASGIDQVNRAVTQMDSVTQANAGQTEELASTAESLSAQAEQLLALVARFKLDEHGMSHAASAHRAPRAGAASQGPVVNGRRLVAPARAMAHAKGSSGARGAARTEYPTAQASGVHGDAAVGFDGSFEEL